MPIDEIKQCERGSHWLQPTEITVKKKNAPDLLYRVIVAYQCILCKTLTFDVVGSDLPVHKADELAEVIEEDLRIPLTQICRQFIDHRKKREYDLYCEIVDTMNGAKDDDNE